MKLDSDILRAGDEICKNHCQNRNVDLAGKRRRNKDNCARTISSQITNLISEKGKKMTATNTFLFRINDVHEETALVSKDKVM